MIYTIILYMTAVLFGGMARLIYRGRIDLIHQYHRTDVTDEAAYGKSIGKGMAVMAGAMALSGTVAIFGTSAEVVLTSVAILVMGLLVGIVWLIRTQKKYNGGVFG